MDTKLSEQMLEYITKSGIPVGLKHENGKDEITIGYSKEKDQYGIAFGRDGKIEDKKRGVTRADMISYISNPGFEADMARIMKRIQEREKAYATLRKSLLAELETSAIPDSEIDELRRTITFLTVMPDYCSFIPRVELSRTRDGEYELNQYIRVGNEYDRSQGIALQLISRVSGPTGNDTDYKKIGLKGLAKMFNDKKIPLDDGEL